MTNAVALPTYSVEPFEMQEREWYCKPGYTPCCICGRPVDDAKAKIWACIGDAGDTWIDSADDAKAQENDDGFMGWWPVGNDCHKKFFVK